MEPPDAISHIFISYAHKDGATLALRLHADLSSKGFDPWLDRRRLHGGATWTTDIEKALDVADCVLALLSPGAYTSDICRAEQLRALRKGKCVIPLLVQQGTEIPLHLETTNYRDFATSSAYSAAFDLLLSDIHSRSGIPMKPEFRTTYVTAPPLPVNFVERPEMLDALREALITDDGGRHIALTALRGMGGIGKTVLAQALCYDEVVQQAFPDGVIWISVGRDPAFDALTRMREVGKALEDDLSRYDNELGAKNQYRTAIRQKAALIVVDDVWRTSDLEPLRAESCPRSRLLFTTRDASIAAATGAREHITHLLTEQQSREVLARWSKRGSADFPPIAENIIRECGRLPLALSMVGAMLRNRPPTLWNHVHDLLRKADLEKIKAHFPDYPHPNLFKAIQVSVEALDNQSRNRYLAMAALPEDMAAPVPILQCLWGVDESEAIFTAEQFVDLSLAQRSTSDGSIQLHDLQLDYTRAQYESHENEDLDLIRQGVILSAHVINADPKQFASQMIGRLLTFQDLSGVADFLGRATEGTRWIWLRPLLPALHPPGASLIRTLEGHSDTVYGVAVTPDGNRVVSASFDKTLKVWDLETGRILRTLDGHCGHVTGVAVMPDGRRAISASDDKTLKVWDLETGRTLRTLKGHSNSVNGVAVTPNDRRAVSTSKDNTVRVWDLETGRVLHCEECRSDFVNGVAITPDGNRAICTFYGYLQVWDLTGRVLCTLEGHSNSVTGVGVTPDGARAVSASSDKTLRVWDLETGCALRTLEGHSDRVSGVAVMPDGKRAISASNDKTLKVWDLETGRVLRTLEGHSDGVCGVALTPDGRQAVSASSDKSVKVWDLDMARPLRKPDGHSDVVYGVTVGPDGKRAVSASWDKTLKLWDLETGRVLRTLEGHSYSVNCVAVTQDYKWVVSGSYDGTLRVWDLETGRSLRRLEGLEGHSDSIRGVALTAGGKRAISASSDRTLKLWDLETGRVLRTLEGHSNSVNDVAVTADCRLVVSASYDGTLRVWDLETGRALRRLEGHSNSVSRVALTPDNRRAISASSDRTLKLWDLETGRVLRTLEGHSNSVTGVAVTPDNRRAASVSSDKTLKVWDLETGLIVASFRFDLVAHCCAFADERRIVGGDAAGRIFLLSIEEPQTIWP